MKFSKYNLIVPGYEKGQQILFNTFNGNCFKINDDIVNKVKNEDLEAIDTDTKGLLAKHGIIIEDDFDEDKILVYMRDKAKYDSSTISSSIMLTWACNLKCTYCFQGHDNRQETMLIEQADKYIKFMISSVKQKNAKNLFILLFGGEPLVNADIGFYILKKLKDFSDKNEINFYSSIVTNGTLLTIDILKKFRSYNCKMIQITLDGVKETHDKRRVHIDGKGSFDKIIEVLTFLKGFDEISTIVRINIDKENLSETYKLLKFIGMSGLDFTKFSVDFGIIRDESFCTGVSGSCFMEHEIGDVLSELWNFAEQEGFKNDIRPVRKNIYCGLYSDNQYTVAPNCDVYKCWEHVGQEDHLIGKLDEEGRLSDIRYAFYDWMSVNPYNNDECKSCVYLPNCGGGCAVVSYNKTGTYHSSGCFKIKGTIEKEVIKYVEKVIETGITPI